MTAGTYTPNGAAGAIFHPVFGGRWSAEPLQPDGTRYPTMGFAAAAWIQAMCGIELDPWQVEILRRAFLYDPETLDWVVADILIVGPEGIGKSAFFAGVGLWLLEGPCLPPVESPRQHPRPNIPIVSAALSLTQHIHRHAKHYVEREGSPLLGRVIVENLKIFRAAHEDHALLFPAGSGAYQQGGEPVPAIIEEELHVLNAVGVKANGEETIRITSSKRTKNANPKVQRWTITNPDDGDPDSLLGSRWAYASRVLDGETVDPELLAIHYHAPTPPDGDWETWLDDDQRLLEAVETATPSSWMPAWPIAKKYRKGDVGLGWFLRFSLGVFYAGDDQVIGDGLLEALAVDRELAGPPPPGVPVALAFDGARNRDSVALSGCTADQYGFIVDSWERTDNAGDDYRYPKMEIYHRVVRAMEVEHPEALLAVDPTWFEDLVYGFEGVDERGRVVELQGWAERWPDRVVVDVQQDGAKAWQQLRQAIKDGEYSWDGDPRLLRHMRNAREVIRTSHGRQIAVLGKKRDDGQHPIDLLVTAAYALRLALTIETKNDDLDEWRDALGLPTGAPS